MREDLHGQLAKVGRRGHRALVAGAIRGGERLVGRWPAAGEAPDARSLFEIGSITKAFTGVLLADMCLRGEVALDDPLSQHLARPRPAGVTGSRPCSSSRRIAAPYRILRRG